MAAKSDNVSAAGKPNHAKATVAKEPAMPHGNNAPILIGAVIVIAIIIIGLLVLNHPQQGTAASTVPVVTSNASNASQTVYTTITVPASSGSIHGCRGYNGFTCTNTTFTTYGLLSFSFVSPTSIYDVHLACTSSPSSSPANLSAWETLMSDGTFKSRNFSGTYVQQGGIENIAGLQCYNETGGKISSIKNGSIQDGYLLISYAKSSSPISISNPLVNVTIAAFGLNATNSGSSVS